MEQQNGRFSDVFTCVIIFTGQLFILVYLYFVCRVVSSNSLSKTTLASWKMEKYLRERQTVLLLRRRYQNIPGGDVKQLIVLNRLRQEVEGFARVATMY